MKDIITVIKFTMKDMVKRKSFIISTLIILVLIVLGFNVPNIIKSIKGEDSEDKLLIVDNENIFEGNLELLKEADLGYEIEVGTASFEEIKDDAQGIIRITLKYDEKGTRVIDGLKRISKPGLRVYASKEELPKVLNGLGIAIISTSKGLKTDKEARELGIGGEVLAYVW